MRCYSKRKYYIPSNFKKITFETGQGFWIHDGSENLKTMVKNYWHHSYHKLKKVSRMDKKTKKLTWKIWDY